jgi:hypothetical protein
MITLSIAGQAADHIDGTGMAQGSEDAEEILIRRYWDGATVRRYGKGYRLTMTAPAWVWAWILDSLDAVLWSDDLSDAERKAFTTTVKAIRETGADKAGAAPRQELEEAGLVEPKAAPVVEVAPVVEEAPQAPVNASTGEGPEPRKISFEKETCERCGGKGRRSDNGWGANHGGLCYNCDGSGQVLTANGYRAREAYLARRDALLGAAFQDLADGEAFWHEGKCFAKGDLPEWVRVHPASRVRRHNGPVTRNLWREIAKRYKGATLDY